MYPNDNTTFSEIKISLKKVYDRIRIPKAQEKGHELFKKIISKNFINKTLLYSLINNMQEKTIKIINFGKASILKSSVFIFFQPIII